MLAFTPFEFRSRLNLTLLTGLRARDLAEMLEHLRTAPGSVIYHHTHRLLVQHQYLSPEPPNDFAYWVSNVLLEERLGEQLAAVDLRRFTSIRESREAFMRVIEQFLDRATNLRVAPAGQEFHFMKSVTFVLPTGIRAHNLRELRDGVGRISLSSIAYHVIDARLRLERGDNDFAKWLDMALGESELAQTVRRLDPYTFTEEGLRQRMIALFDARLREMGNGRA